MRVREASRFGANRGLERNCQGRERAVGCAVRAHAPPKKHALKVVANAASREHALKSWRCG
jgi:hypothetical protein